MSQLNLMHHSAARAQTAHLDRSTSIECDSLQTAGCFSHHQQAQRSLVLRSEAPRLSELVYPARSKRSNNVGSRLKGHARMTSFCCCCCAVAQFVYAICAMLLVRSVNTSFASKDAAQTGCNIDRCAHPFATLTRPTALCKWKTLRNGVVTRAATGICLQDLARSKPRHS